MGNSKSMCDSALCFACEHLLPLLKEATNTIRGVPKEIADMKEELESIEDFINKAGRLADAEEDNISHGIKGRIKQLIEASFHIQDVIDEYIFLEEKQSLDPGCVAGAADLVKTMIIRLQIAYKIQNIKSQTSEIKDTRGKDHDFPIQSSLEQGPSSSTNATLLNLRKALKSQKKY
jgi:disease resistance protein RPM1